MATRPLRVNFRDVSKNIKGIKSGKLYRSSVCFTPPEDVRAIIDLRRKEAKAEAWHVPASTDRLVVRHHIPMVGHRGALSLLWKLPFPTLIDFIRSKGSEVIVGNYYFATPDNIVDMYLRIAEHASVEMLKIAQVIAEAEEGGVVVFCVAGKDRTGIVVAMFARLAGASIEDIANDYASSQKNLAEANANGELMLVDPLLMSSVLTQSPWEAMVAFLRTIESRYGSVRRFFEKKLQLPPVLLDQIVEILQDKSALTVT